MREMSHTAVGQYDAYGEPQRSGPPRTAATSSRRFQAVVLGLFWALALALIIGRLALLDGSVATPSALTLDDQGVRGGTLSPEVTPSGFRVAFRR